MLPRKKSGLCFSVPALMAGFSAGMGVCAQAANPPTLNPSVVTNPAAFRYTTFASGLNFPHSMIQLSDGSFLVSTSDPVGAGGVYSSTGTIRHFVDTITPGVADNPQGTVVYGGLPGTLTSLRQAGDLLFVSSSGASPGITVLQMPSSPDGTYAMLGTISFGFPTGWEHTHYATAVQPAGAPNTYDLYFNIGSQSDNVTTPSSTVVPVSGLITANLHGDSIYRTTVHDNGNGVAPTFTNLTQIASGLRNAAGIAVQPGSGDLYFEDNGIDSPATDPNYYNNHGSEYGADSIHKIPAAQIGQGTVPDFGFAHNYYQLSNGAHVGDNVGTPPLQIFQSVNGKQNEGASEIAFAPAGFPTGLNSGIFVTFHGTSESGAADNQNALVYYDPATNQYSHLIDGGQSNLGHIDGLLTTNDSLFMTDLATSNYFFNAGGDGSGAIYELTAIPEPATAELMSVGAMLMLRRRRRAR